MGATDPHCREGAGLTLHLQSRGDGPVRVTFTAEGEQQRIPAELEVVAAERRGRVEQHLEVAVDDGVQALGALAAELGQPFGERREPGDVGDDQRAVQRFDPPTAVGPCRCSDPTRVDGTYASARLQSVIAVTITPPPARRPR